MFKISGFDNQKATTYITYMMVSSYFNKAYLVSQTQAKRLFLEYKEMPSKNQLKTEELVLSLMNKKSMGNVSRFENLNCEVEISQKQSYYEVRFDTLGFGCIIASVDEKGKIQISLEEDREEAKASS